MALDLTIKEKQTEKIFDYEYISDLVERYADEAEERSVASLNRYGEHLHLTILQKNIFDETTSLSVYIFPDTRQIYEAMDQMFDEHSNSAFSNGSRFTCSVAAMVEVLGPYQVVSEELQL